MVFAPFSLLVKIISALELPLDYFGFLIHSFMRAILSALFSFLSLACFAQATPVVVADICPGGCSSSPSNLVEMNGKVYFFATSPVVGRELHVYDGTGVSVVADINPGSGSGVRSNSSLTLFGNKLYFAANDTANLTRYYLFSYNGVSQPEHVLSNGMSIPTSGQSGVVGSDLVFAYNDSANRTQFAKYTPASNTFQIFYVGDRGFKGDCPCNIIDLNGFAFYTGAYYPPNYGARMPRITNPGTGGTVLPGTLDLYFSLGTARLINGEVYSAVSHGIGTTYYQVARFRTSPPPAQNTIVMGTPSTLPFGQNEIGVYNGRVYYQGFTTPATPTAGRSLFQFDPTTSGLNAVAQMPAPPSDFGYGLSLAQAAGNVLYLGYQSATSGVELFGYTTSSGMAQITNIDGPTAGLNPTDIVSYNGNLLIAGTTSTNGTELYRITGNGLGLTEAQRISAAMLSPNPASSELTITLPSAARYTMRVVSATGQILRTHTLHGPSASVPVQHLPAGMYFVHLTDAITGAPAGTARFVKE